MKKTFLGMVASLATTAFDDVLWVGAYEPMSGPGAALGIHHKILCWPERPPRRPSTMSSGSVPTSR